MSTGLSLDEFLDLYGDVEVTFSSYYKFVFTYTAAWDDIQLSVYVGGSAGDIYKNGVEAGRAEKVRLLDVTRATVLKSGEEYHSLDSGY